MTKKNEKKKKTIWYRQCTFTSKTEAGHLTETAWIPEKFAVEGRTIYFGKKTDDPETLWKVGSVGDVRKTGEYLGDHERDHLRTRQYSDI